METRLQLDIDCGEARLSFYANRPAHDEFAWAKTSMQSQRDLEVVHLAT